MIYQEQVMRVLNRLGGIELASAYAASRPSAKEAGNHRQRKGSFLGVPRSAAHREDRPGPFST